MNVIADAEIARDVRVGANQIHDRHVGRGRVAFADGVIYRVSDVDISLGVYSEPFG